MKDGSITGNHRGLPQRKTIRLRGYDYSRAGLYFITICAQNRLCLFGEIENGEMILNDAGIMIERQWEELIYRFDNIKSDEFIVMPNHFHGIVQIISNPEPVGAGPCACPINEWQQINSKPQQTIGQPQQTIGQPRGVAPTMSLFDIVHLQNQDRVDTMYIM